MEVGIGHQRHTVDDKLGAQRGDGVVVVSRLRTIGAHRAGLAERDEIGLTHIGVLGISAGQQLHQVGNAVGLEMSHGVAPDDRRGRLALSGARRHNHLAQGAYVLGHPVDSLSFGGHGERLIP